MADCVFEVSGSAPGVEVMTELPGVHGRIVMVAIHPQPKPVNLFKFFWSELRLIGARLYEERDFGDAIKLTPWESFTKDIILLVMILAILVLDKNQIIFGKSFTILEKYDATLFYCKI